MLQGYSQRATLVMFIARIKAGKDGVKMADLDHLLEAIVIEDQGEDEIAKVLVGKPHAGSKVDGSLESRSKPFFSPELASQLLASIKELFQHAQPVPTSQDMPGSPDLGRTLSAALDLRNKFQAEKVEPLHLLAAGLGEQSSRAAHIFRDAGITQEKVLNAIRENR